MRSPLFWQDSDSDSDSAPLGVTMMRKVGDDRADQRHEPADSGMMARDRASHTTPCVSVRHKSMFYQKR